MKRISKITIGLVILFGALLLVGVNNSIAQDTSTTCSLNSQDFVWTISNIVEGTPIIANAAVSLTINTTNCKNYPLNLEIYSADNGTSKTWIETANGDKQTLNITTGQEGGSVKFIFQTHEDNCFGGQTPDCKYYLKIISGIDSTELINTLSIAQSIQNQFTNPEHDWKNPSTYNMLLSQGVLFADCDGVCDATFNKWKLTNLEGTNTGNTGNETEVVEPLTPTYDPDSPCYDATANNGSGGYFEDCYEFLAPIPGFTTKHGGELVTTEDGRVGILDVTNFQVGDYINSIFQIALGVLTLIAVIMIVIAGVQYMTVESFHGKSDAKNRIKGSATGLVLALGIYIILGTINPELLEVNFGKDIENVALEGVPGIDGLGDNFETAASSDNDINWIQQNGRIITLHKKSGGTISVPPCDSQNMQTIEIFGKNFTVHSSLVPSLQRINQKWEQAGGNNFYRIPASNASAGAMGAYNCRTAKGSSRLSWHSYGLAIDINPQENPYGRTLKTNMPQAFVNMWKQEGYGWGGDWTSKKDAMHFSKLPNEKGDGTVD